MANKTTAWFKDKANKKHNNKYIYPDPYVNTRTPIMIVCLDHGEFWQTPRSHLSGNGCLKCGLKRAGQKVRAQRIAAGCHSLSDVDKVNKTAHCVVCCKQVAITKRGNGVYKCSEYEFARRRTYDGRFLAAIRQARKRHIDWDITKEMYIGTISKECYYCHNELGEPVEVGTGLDRLDSSKGYTKENIVSCCEMCNKIKGEHLTPSQTKLIVGILVAAKKLSLEITTDKIDQTVNSFIEIMQYGGTQEKNG